MCRLGRPWRLLVAVLALGSLTTALGAAAQPAAQSPPTGVGAPRAPLDQLPQAQNFELVGHTIVPNPGETVERGRNGSVSLAPPCAYVGNRLGRRSGTGPNFGTPALPPEVAIVDVSDPSRPRVAGYLPTPRGGTNRELRALPEVNALYVMNFAANVPGFESGPAELDEAVNNFMIYDVTDCQRPVLRSTIDLGAWAPHEFFVWRDRQTPDRVLVYLSSNAGPWLKVYDVTGATRGAEPRLAATFTMDAALPSTEPTAREAWDPSLFRFVPRPTSQTNAVHAMTLEPDGTRVYVAGRHAGFYVLDSTLLARGAPCTPDNVTVDATTNADPTLCLRKVNPDPAARLDPHPPLVQFTHSANKLPGRPYVLVSDERNGTETCPWSWGRVVDVTDELAPRVLSQWMLPENAPSACAVGGPGDAAYLREFSAHQILPLANLFFQSWYSGGLRAWDVSDPGQPVEVGVFAPRPEYPNVVEAFRNSPDVWTWSYPVLSDGLIYVVDENSGLFIVRYTGPRRGEVPARGLLEGNAVH